MSVLYTPIPASEFLGHEGKVTWLQHFGLTLPAHIKQGRYPTPKEIRTVLEGLDGYTIKYFVGTQTWQAEVRETLSREQGAWTEIVVLDFLGTQEEEDVPHKFYFDRGHPELVVQILEKLARFCGPFILVTNGIDPILVMPANL